MPNGQQQPREVEKTEPLEELKKARVSLHNLKFQTQMTEAIIKKLEELSR